MEHRERIKYSGQAILIQQVYQFFLDFVINMPVTCKGTASFRMSRHGCNQIRVFDLLVEVADKCLSCSMGGRHFISRFCHILACLRVKDSHHAVNAHILENLLYLLVIAEVREPGK